MENNNISYQFDSYIFGKGAVVVHSGSEMIFSGNFFDLNGNIYYKGFYPCIFKYIQGDKYYIEVDGKLYWTKRINLRIERFKVLNGEKIPNPITEDEVKSGFILLLFVMAISSIFKGNVGLWIFEIIYYLNWSYHKKYD